MNDIPTIKANLKALLEAREDVLAAWEGGSVATGFSDDYSDLDLHIVIDGSNPEAIFELLGEHFEAQYGIERLFRIPEPAWHGMSQCFYLLRDCPACFYCDIAVTSNANPNKFTEPDRHGDAAVWFDKQSVYHPMPTPQEDQLRIIQRVLKSVFAVDFLTEIELQKAVLRGKWIPAQMNWQMFLNRCLVPLLNVKYRPAKADFGIRYTEREYPPEAAQTLADLLCYSSVKDIANKTKVALDLYYELKDQLSEEYLGEE